MEILKPKNESRILTGNVLENGIKFINVNDLNLDRSHVMVSVNIGSLFNPVEFQGLAHFLEHMLFLGSKKYPGENQFEKFLNENGGMSNAYTATFETVYYFSVFNNKLEKAIDMFSRFFIDPLFDSDSVNRELNAIDSEHNKNIQNDQWRLQHFFGLISKKDSLINKFGTGNLETLQKDGVREAMIQFYNNHYVSSNINVVTVSSIDNETVSKLVEKSFSNIPNKSVPKLQIEKPFFDNNPTNYFVKSVSKNDNIVYLWEIPDHVTNYLTSHSPHIISHVISSDNDKSLKQILIKKGLIKTLYSYVLDEGLFILNVKLSNLNNWKEVDSYIKFYIDDLKNQNWFEIANYFKKKDSILFNFSSKEESNDLGLKLVSNLIYYPIEKAYIGADVIENINVDQINSLLNEYLLMEKANIIITADNLISTSDIRVDNFIQEKYYGIEYSQIEIETLPEASFEYEIITENPFLETKPEWIDGLDEILEPTQISGYPFKVWFGNVSKFNETRIYSELIFTNSEITFEMSNTINTLILLRYINRKISKDFNLATEIGFYTNISLDTDDSIVTVSITGHNDKFIEYFNMINEYIREFNYSDDDQTMINMIINELKDNYNNIKKLNPWKYSYYLEEINMYNNSITIDEAINYLNSIDINTFSKKINEIKNRILYQSKFTILIYGNVTFQKIFNSDNNINLIYPSIEKPKNKVKKLIDIDCIHPNEDEKDNFVQYSYYIGNFLPRNNLLLLLLAVSLNQKFYDEIRTKQQFGYLVSASRSSYQNDIYYFKQKVQSSRSVENIEEAINIFNTNFLSTVSEEDFNKYLTSAKNILEERDNSTRELFGRYLDEIYYNKFIFNRRELMLQYVKKITFKEYRNFFTNNILNGQLSKLIIRHK